jgi:Ca-activated chloride channel family protein
VSRRIPEFYNRIRNPLLQNISLSFSAGEVYEIYPLPLPDIYVGEQLVVLGRYKQPGDARAMLKGKSAGNAVALDYDVHFTGDSLVDIFIPKMWAKYKIDALLVMMRTVGQNSNQWKEWRDEIIRLSRAYGILSPFSSFSDPGSGNGGGGASTVEPETPRRAGTISLRSFPNPFRAATSLTFAIPSGAAAHTTITIYDMAGRVVAVVTDEMLEPGLHQIAWHGRDALGNDLPAGVYLCEIRIGGETHIERLVLMR